MRPKNWSPEQEKAFRQYYNTQRARVREMVGFSLNPNPDDPGHFYDYRKAYLGGARPDKRGHWPSTYKIKGHPTYHLKGK